jgi:hypothetical protein
MNTTEEDEIPMDEIRRDTGDPNDTAALDDTGDPEDTGAPLDRQSYWLGREVDAKREVERGLADLRQARRELRLGDIPPVIHGFGRRAFEAGLREGQKKGFHDGEKRGIHEGERRVHHELDRLKRELEHLRAGEKHEHHEIERLRRELEEARRHHHHRRYSPRMEAFRYDIIERYKRRHGGSVHVGEGYYRGTIQVPFLVEGNTTSGVFTLPTVNPNSPTQYTCFDMAEGDTEQWIGGPHVLTPADTNLANAGTNLFQDELFIIEGFSLGWKGVRVVYASGVTSLFTGVTQQALEGLAWIYDASGNMLPSELFQPFSDECRLAKVLGETATLHFLWQDNAIGGNKTSNDIMVYGLADIPSLGRRVRDVRHTSGGAREGVLELPVGYIWCVDRQFQASTSMGGNGLFSAAIEVSDSAAFPFTPVGPGGTSPALPTSIAVYYELTLHGTSLLPGDGGDLWKEREREERRRERDDWLAGYRREVHEHERDLKYEDERRRRRERDRM